MLWSIAFCDSKMISSPVLLSCMLCLSIVRFKTVAKLNPDKKLLRVSIGQKINALTEAQKAEESKIVREQLLNHPVFKDSKRVSVYVSRDDEVNTHEIIKDNLKLGKELFIPRYEKKEMQMLKLESHDLDKLVKNKDNILQISKDKPAVDALKTGGLDLVLMPGLAFTRDGKRCGRGGGYYDKYLDDLKKVSPNFKAVGLAFGCQVVDDLPMDKHDMKLHHVIHPLKP